MSHQSSRRDYGYKPHQSQVSRKAKVMMRAVEKEKLAEQEHKPSEQIQIMQAAFNEVLGKEKP